MSASATTSGERRLDLPVTIRRATRAAALTRPGAQIIDVRRLEGGVSSLTFAATLADDRGEQPIVLKVAPPGLEPVRNRDVLRQARVLRRLAGTEGFPVPGVLFEDGDRPPLFGMEFASGESYEPRIDTSDSPPSADIAAERMLVAARALAGLHARTPESLGLAHETVSTAGDELARWARLLATVDTEIAPRRDTLRDRLAERTPGGVSSVLLHGDYRLGNMLFTGAHLEAVIDWEIWSVGDPRCDLAWLLMHTDPAHVLSDQRSAADVAAGSALPSRSALLDEYLAARSRHGATKDELAAVTRDLPWFLGLSYYKTAATLAVLVKHNRRSARPADSLLVAERHLDGVLEAGNRAIG